MYVMLGYRCAKTLFSLFSCFSSYELGRLCVQFFTVNVIVVLILSFSSSNEYCGWLAGREKTVHVTFYSFPAELCAPVCSCSGL